MTVIPGLFFGAWFALGEYLAARVRAAVTRHLARRAMGRRRALLAAWRAVAG